jgi:hypothetical protein
MNMKQWIGVGSLCVSIFSTNILAHEACALHGQQAASAPVQPAALLVPGDAAVKAASSTAATVGTEKKGAVTTDAANQSGQANQAGQPDQLLFQVLDGNKDVIKAFMDSLVSGSLQKRMQQMEEKRLRLLNTLPEALRTSVQGALKKHMHAAEQLKLDVFLRRECGDIFERIQRQIPDDAPCKKDAITAIELLNRALSDGSFMRVVTVFQLSGDMQDPQRMMRQLLDMIQQSQEQSTFTEKDIVTIRTTLEAVRQYAQEHSFETTGLFGFLATDLATFIQYLDWAAQRDVRSLSSACIDKTSPLIDECLSTLKATVGVLADERLHVSQEAKPELVEALEFWMKQFKANIQTLTAFQRVVMLSGIDLSYVMLGMSYAYELAEGYFDYKRFDERNNTGTGLFWVDKAVAFFNSSNALDLGMRCAMLGLTGVHRVGEVASGEIQKCILGTGSLTDFVNPFNEPSYVMMLLMGSPSVLMHPSQQRLTVLQRGFLRVSGVLLWNLWSKRGKNGFANWPIKKAPGANKDATDNKGSNANNNNVPADPDVRALSDFFTTTLLITIKELQWSIANEAVAAVKCKDHPRDGKPCQHCIALEKLENYSLGIIKPDLIHLAFELLSTIALFKSDGAAGVVGDLSAESYAMHYASRGFLLDDWMFKRAYNKPQARADGTYPEHPKHISKDEKINFYIEYQIVRYLFESVGAFCGKNIVHKPIYATLSGTAKAIGSLLGTVGKFVFDISDEDEKAIVSQYQRYITDMRTVLRSLFNEQSPERVMIVGLLKNMRYLTEEDNDPKKVNFSIIALVLYYLSQYNLITHVQEAQLYEEYFKNQNDVMKFLDIVFNTIDENKASIMGGIVGGIAGHVLASYVELRYGPFVLKDGLPAAH